MLAKYEPNATSNQMRHTKQVANMELIQIHKLNCYSIADNCFRIRAHAFAQFHLDLSLSILIPADGKQLVNIASALMGFSMVIGIYIAFANGQIENTSMFVFVFAIWKLTLRT